MAGSDTADLGGDDPSGGDRLVGADRVLAILVELAGLPDGATLDELARRSRSPKATVHRALGALRRAGLARSDARGHYVLGDDFLRLAFQNHEARPDHVRVRPILERLADRFGETAHFGVLDGHSVVYRAKVDPTAGAVRLTSTVGGRNPAHCTAVGIALLAHQLHTLTDVETWIGDRPLERRTGNTATSADELFTRLQRARDRGFAVDDQENEPGINCLAVPLSLGSAGPPFGAVSVSAVAYRTPLSRLVDSADEVKALVAEFGGFAAMSA